MAVYVAPTDLTDADVVCHEGRRIVFVDPGEVTGLRLTKGAGVILPAFLLSDVYRGQTRKLHLTGWARLGLGVEPVAQAVGDRVRIFTT